ncbi:hypothetical protein LWI28_023030 [Acer negundo]|uniref:Uncharacterized protein n=1 Tax=Acer negundo TaxID=4023 RepID=A0AAD5JBP4_ACENE|nr:hypothetical protein LWI28_023030 [Acer negundo]
MISLINDAKKELKGDPIKPWEKWQLAITLPWNGVRHVLTTDEHLMFCFEEFDRHDKPVIEFELILVSNDMEFPVDLLAWKEGFNAENISAPEENVEDDNNYEVVDELEDDSDVSLGEEDHVADFGNPDHCDPDGDESIIIPSFDEENGLTRAARYCRDNQ